MSADSNASERAARLELPLPIVLIGAGERAFAGCLRHARRHRTELEIRAIVDPDPSRRERALRFLASPTCLAFGSFGEVPRSLAEGCLHGVAAPLPEVLPLVRELALAGQAIALLPPWGDDRAALEELMGIARTARGAFFLADEGRASRFHRATREIVRSAEIGEVRTLLLRRDDAATKTAHRMIRGALARGREDTRTFLLERIGPDLEAICHLLDDEPVEMEARGASLFLGPGQAPPGATERCDAPCPAAPRCPFEAERRYSPDQRDWPFTEGDVLLADSPYGRCVYRHGVRVIDHLSLRISFARREALYVWNGGAASSSTWLELTGTSGSLRALEERSEILVRPLGKAPKSCLKVATKVPPFVELVREWRFELAHPGRCEAPRSLARQARLAEILDSVFAEPSEEAPSGSRSPAGSS